MANPKEASLISRRVREASSGAAHKVSQVPPWKPDIYVKAFVPQYLVAINQAPAIVINAPSIQSINYEDYIGSFAGSDFLSVLDPIPFPDTSKAKTVESADVSISNYGKYFSNALALDLEARIPEIRYYDMFGINLELKDQPQQIYSLVVPGIRENTPYVSLGDLIVLRQLIVDPATGMPFGVDAWLAAGGAAATGGKAPGFTGYQMNAVIRGVDKAKEMLHLRIDGMMWANRSICNVSFVVPDRLIHGPERAVGDISQELNPVTNPFNIPGSASSNKARFLRTNQVPVERSAVKLNTRLRQQRPMSPEVNGVNALSASVETLDLSREPPESTWLRRVLFPEEAFGIQQTKLPSVIFPQVWCDDDLNYEQKVCRSRCRSVSKLINQIESSRRRSVQKLRRLLLSDQRSSWHRQNENLVRNRRTIRQRPRFFWQHTRLCPFQPSSRYTSSSLEASFRPEVNAPAQPFFKDVRRSTPRIAATLLCRK